MPVLIKRAVNLAKGSAEPHKTKVGKITEEQVEEIAKIKMPDLNCFDVEAAMRSVAARPAAWASTSSRERSKFSATCGCGGIGRRARFRF